MNALALPPTAYGGQPEPMAPGAGSSPVDPRELRSKLAEHLGKIYSDFAKKRDKWVLARASSGVERRWRRADTLYNGDNGIEVESLEDTLRNGPTARGRGKAAPRSRVSVNIVRPKVTVAVARMCEIELPLDDKNFAFALTPDPELEDALSDPRQLLDPNTGQPVRPVAEAAGEEKAQAQKEMAAAERKVNDYLTECNFDAEQRKVIDAGTRLGTGVMKGPYPIKRAGKKAADGTTTFDIRLASREVSCWNTYPDPSCGNDIQRGSGIFEKRPVTRKELRALIGVPGYDEEAIRELLKETPKKVVISESRATRQNVEDESYELWEYTGEIEPEVANDVPLFLADPQKAGLLSEEGDPLLVDQAVVVMVQDRIIGVLPMWTEDLPYDFWNWRKADDSPFGFGLPDELDNQQRVVTSCWRQVMDNGALAAGGVVVMKKGVIEAQEGDNTLSSRKIFLANEEVEDVRTAFTVVTFTSIVKDLLGVLKAANELADQESTMPLLMQGDTGTAPDTFGGLSLLWRQANSPMRHRLKGYDDSIVVPHATRYFKFVRDNEPDNPNFVRDYQVHAKGSTVLIERDMQQQGLMAVAKLLENEVFRPYLEEKAPEALRAIIKGFMLDPDSFTPSEDEIKQRKAKAANEPPPPAPPDPQVVRAETQLQVKTLELQDRAEDRAAAERKQDKELGYKRESLQYNAQREQSEYTIAMTEADLSRMLALLELQKDADNATADRALKERLEMLRIDNQRQIFNAESVQQTNIAGGV